MNKSETSKILEGMSEAEMAFFARFKLPYLSREAKRDLREILRSKGLTKSKIKSITSELEFSETNGKDTCDRCGTHKVYRHKTSNERSKIHCLICGFVEGSNKSKLGLLRSLFGS